MPGVHDNPMIAPQANAMASIIEPLMQPGASVPWMLFAFGAIISLLINWLGLPSLAFALGMFIPLQLNTPLIVGGLLHKYLSTGSKDKEVNKAREQRGTLISSGFIAGAALFGVIGALLLFFDVDLNFLHVNQMQINGSWDWIPGCPWPEILSLIAFILLIVYFIWDSKRIK